MAADERDDDPDLEEDLELELVPPDAGRVARRALVLAALAYRAGIEHERKGGELQTRLAAWLSITGLVEELEPHEERILHAPAGALERDERVNASWRSEGLVVLAWALGVMDMPPHDEQQAAGPIAEALGFLNAAPLILTAPRLRAAEEVLGYGERAFAVHWRLRQFSLDHKPMDFATFAKEAYFGPLEVEGLPFIDGDLAIRGEPIARSPHWREVMSIALERHQAANWVSGYASLYSEVGTDT